METVFTTYTVFKFMLQNIVHKKCFSSRNENVLGQLKENSRNFFIWHSKEKQIIFAMPNKKNQYIYFFQLS